MTKEQEKKLMIAMLFSRYADMHPSKALELAMLDYDMIIGEFVEEEIEHPNND